MPKQASKPKRPADINQLAAAAPSTPLPKKKAPSSPKNPAAVALGRLGGAKGGPARAATLRPPSTSTRLISTRAAGSKRPSIAAMSRSVTAFHRTGAIEVWGRGTNRVIEACLAYGIAEPTFTEGSGAVTVVFKADVVADAGTKVHAALPDVTLTERQRAILHSLEQKPAMALREFSAALEGAPSDRRLREELLSLKQRGLVEQSGHGRGSSWSRRRRAV